MILISGCERELKPEQSWVGVPEENFNYEAIGSGQLSFKRLSSYSRIYLLDAGNSSTKKLENNWAAIHSAVLSPDGKTIAMAALRKSGQKTQIYLIGTDEPHVRSISSDHSVSLLSWVPEGKDIIYLGFFSNGLYSQSIINTGDSGLRLIRTFFPGLDLPESRISVSISGHLIFFLSSVSNNFFGDIKERGLYSMDMEGENLQLLSTDQNTNRYSHASPQWSPDGSQIAFISLIDDKNGQLHNFESQEIRVMDKDSTNIRTLIQLNIPPGQAISGLPIHRGITLSWSPDGSKIAFTKLEGNLESHIYIVDIKTGQLEQVTFGDGVNDYFVSWSK